MAVGAENIIVVDPTHKDGDQLSEADCVRVAERRRADRPGG